MAILFTLVCAMASSLGAVTLNSEEDEYRAKANYLAQFPYFVEWPANASDTTDSSFRFCVYGDFRFGTSLAEALRSTTVHGRRMELQWVRKVKELRGCQLLFVSRSEEKHYVQILDGLRGASIFTIGETPAFLEAGGDVYIYPENDALRFEVNLSAVQRGRLKLSARLLVLARRVLSDNGELKRTCQTC
ncbi:MAG: YfiR family protein [Acidobacteriia bacterium]|nr:YfiR family protein [Terriglobia bacterium]